MKELNLPAFSFNIKQDNDASSLIYDEIRRKYVHLTPEEWVRQHFIKYLVNKKDYPPGLIGVEVMFKMNRLVRRADILVYDRKGQPAMIVECKAPAVRISAAVFDQIVEYNLKFRLKFIVVTNGLKHFACLTDPVKGKWAFLETLPHYDLLNEAE